jgi:hypothetical protein
MHVCTHVFLNAWMNANACEHRGADVTANEIDPAYDRVQRVPTLQRLTTCTLQRKVGLPFLKLAAPQNAGPAAQVGFWGTSKVGSRWYNGDLEGDEEKRKPTVQIGFE